MPNRGGIKAKLLKSLALQSGVVLAVVFSVVMIVDWKQMNRDLRKLEGNFRKSIMDKARHITKNNAFVIRSLAEENSVSSIREIVNTVVSRDSDFVYGIYMDDERKPWAFSTLLDYGKHTDIRTPLGDSMSLWAAGLRRFDYKSWFQDGRETIEFAAPVGDESEIYGVIRIGVTTRQILAAIADAKMDAGRNRRNKVGVFLLLGLTAFGMSLGLSGFLAGRLTKPIVALTASAKRIAKGDYDTAFNIAGEGEIAVLAETFEAMRSKVQEYTHNLEALVEEKVRQLKDILNNVDQGLFTFNPDLRINPEHSLKAVDILKTKGLAGLSLPEALRFTPGQESLFRAWTELVLREYGNQRWPKLTKLVPVGEITLAAEGGERIVQLEYRKILDQRGKLSKIMVLTQDVTEKRAIERRLLEEKILHEGKVKVILGVAGNPPEIISDFLKDIAKRLDALRHFLENEADGDPEAIRRAFSACHTLKGNAGSFGFDAMVQAAQDMETILQSLAAGTTLPDWRTKADAQLKALREETKKIGEFHQLLAGNSEEPYVRLAESKVEKIRLLAERQTGRAAESPELRILVEACRALSHRSLASMTRKYRELVTRASQKLGKEVALTVTPADAEIAPALILRIDEALIHIIRNSVAHGIESGEERQRSGKGTGRIEFSYARGNGAHVFRVRDDGRGIDGETLAAKAVASGLLTPEAAASLDSSEKQNLMFRSGLSTAAGLDSLSGRGLGMSIALNCVQAAGGTLSVESRPGIDTCFTIALPVSGWTAVPRPAHGLPLEAAA